MCSMWSCLRKSIVGNWNPRWWGREQKPYCQKDSTLKVLKYKPFQTYGWGGSVEPPTVKPIHLICIGCHKISWNWRVNASGSQHIQPCCYSSCHPLQPQAFPWLHCKWPAFTGWQMQFIQLEYSMLYLNHTDWNQHPELAISTIQLCWHILFEIKLAQSSTAIHQNGSGISTLR